VLDEPEGTMRTLISIAAVLLSLTPAFAQAPAARPAVAGTPGGREIYGNEHHAATADWRGLTAKNLRRPVVGYYRRL
jgi:hypothetical protein